jgi:hypothetical protein
MQNLRFAQEDRPGDFFRSLPERRKGPDSVYLTR